MDKKRQHMIPGITAGILIFLVIHANGFGYIMGNRGGSAYAGDNGPVIETHITRAAGHYLDSQSHWLRFLTGIELSELQGVDYNELGKQLTSAITGMEQAAAEYNALILINEKLLLPGGSN